MSPLKEAEAFYRGVLGAEAHLPETLILKIVQNQLTALEKARVEAHVLACARCRGDVEALLKTPPPVPTRVAKPEKAPPVERPEPTASPRRPALALPRGLWVLVPLALGALTMGVLYAKNRPKAPAPTPSPVPLASPSPAPTEDLARFRAAYEAQLALERGRVAQLEKQVAALKQLPQVSASPTPASSDSVRLKPERLPVPTLSQRAVSLSARPTVSWKPTPKAVSYSVELLSASGKRVEKAVVRKTEWRTTKALKRGTTYRWRVTALGRTKKPLGPPQLGGVTVMAKGEASRLSSLFSQLGDELSRLGFRTEAATARARAASLR